MIATLFAAAGCAPVEEDTGSHGDFVSVPGPWVPTPEATNAGNTQYVRYDGPPLIANGGSCSSTNAFACSCVHPACSRGLPGTIDFAGYLRRRFSQIYAAGGFDCCRQNTGDTRYLSVHSIGRAIDLMIREVSPGVADNTAGDAVANWLISHAEEIGVQIVIWDRSSWRVERPAGSKLRDYTGPIPHTDHIHMELSLDGANRRTRFFTSGAINGDTTCTPHCEGTVIVNADCSTGDCGAFGVSCLADPTPRCGTPGCPATGTGAICQDSAHIVNCNNGVTTGVGDCSAYGSFCSTAGVGPTEARCVFSLCVDGPSMVPVPHVGCSITPGTQLDCDANGQGHPMDCPSGQVCSMLGGTSHCEAPHAECPVPAAGAPLDLRTACLASGQLVRCLNGNVVEELSCGSNSVCSALGGTPHCADQACVDASGAVRSGDVCTAGGEIAACDGSANFTDVRVCPSGETCTVGMAGAACAPGTSMNMDNDDLPSMMVLDAGTASSDAGVEVDGGMPARDASSTRDGSVNPQPTMGGCGCRTVGFDRNAHALGSMAIALAGIAARRRRRRLP